MANWSRDPISGGKFVDIDVEHFVKKSTESGNRMSQTTSTHCQVCWPCDFAPMFATYYEYMCIYIFKYLEAKWGPIF